MIAIIPARGGSKELPGKNIKIINGKPLIAWTIETALSSNYIKDIIISTDDKKIASIAESYGGKVPFLRPSELAQDNSKAIDNYICTLEKLHDDFNFVEDEFIVLHPTSPLRLTDDIDSAIELFYKKRAESVISVTKLKHPIQWMVRINKNKTLYSFFDKDLLEKNRQEFSKVYIPNGAIYILKYSLIKEKHTYYSARTYAYIMPPERSIDIDNSLDFEIAELLLRKQYDSIRKNKSK